MTDECITSEPAQAVPPARDELLEQARRLAGTDALHLLKPEFELDDILAMNPHRFELVLLSSVLLFRPQAGVIVGVKRFEENEFWVRSYSPGAAIFPHAFMIEAAGQLCSYYWQKTQPQDKRTFALGEIKSAQFYADVTAGQSLILVVKAVDMNRRKAQFDTAGFVDSQRVFGATIVGMALG